MTEELDFSKMGGLVPAVVQHAEEGTVLMVGFMNAEALQQTKKDGQVVFWSRSRQRLWKKGETSGNFLDVVSIRQDCDNDALLITAIPRGPVCHTGRATCFPDVPETPSFATLGKLAGTIRWRKEQMPEGSYTTELFSKGVKFIGQKVGEEAVELAIAAQYDDRQRCIEETADLLYHVLVLLRAKDIQVSEISGELKARMPAPARP